MTLLGRHLVGGGREHDLTQSLAALDSILSCNFGTYVIIFTEFSLLINVILFL